jgi:hypothetical protein
MATGKGGSLLDDDDTQEDGSDRESFVPNLSDKSGLQTGVFIGPGWQSAPSGTDVAQDLT